MEKETSLSVCKECKGKYKKVHKREFCSEECRKTSEKKRKKEYLQANKGKFAGWVRKYAHNNKIR